jgi:hypothetical protein
MDLRIESLYRVSFDGSGSDYWQVVGMSEKGISLRCLGLNRKHETILVDYDNVIIEATNAAYIGKAVMYAAFSTERDEQR